VSGVVRLCHTIESYAHAFVGGAGGGPRKVEACTFDQVNIIMFIVYMQKYQQVRRTRTHDSRTNYSHEYTFIQ